jgi:ABC-type lipoprotein release transport system permease subunit
VSAIMLVSLLAGLIPAVLARKVDIVQTLAKM